MALTGSGYKANKKNKLQTDKTNMPLEIISKVAA
jgi:hypothetical protein